ncbi:MAG: PEP-CTERM sorting domain-containing protein [Planctomycetota bacterium]
MFRLALLVGLMAILSPGTSRGGIVITEVDLANNLIELTNDGIMNVDISTWWLCNRVNGSPFYATVSSATSINGSSFEASGAADLILENGDVLVLNVDAGLLPDANGEFAFYNTNSFGSTSAIEDYILWGNPGIRDIVADNAGLWIDNESIDVSGIGAGETIQLLSGTGVQASEYGIAPATLGFVAAVPEPSVTLVLSAGALIVSARRKRR